MSFLKYRESIFLTSNYIYYNFLIKITAYGGMLKYKIHYQEPKGSNGWSDLRPYLPHIMILGNANSLVIPVDSLDGKSRPKLELLEVKENIVFLLFSSRIS